MTTPRTLSRQMSRRDALAVVLLQRLRPVRVGHARVGARARLELLAEELLPSLAVRRGPLVASHVALLLLLHQRRLPVGVPVARVRRFVVGLRDARRGRQAGGGGIRRLVCARGPACGLGRVRAACGRSMRARGGGRVRRAACGAERTSVAPGMAPGLSVASARTPQPALPPHTTCDHHGEFPQPSVRWG